MFHVLEWIVPVRQGASTFTLDSLGHVTLVAADIPYLVV